VGDDLAVELQAGADELSSKDVRRMLRWIILGERPAVLSAVTTFGCASMTW
jgi:hypothetical protein